MSRLLENSTPAERQRRCTFAERFNGAANLALNGGVITGSATWISNGLQFNTVNTFVYYATRNVLPTHTWSAYCGCVEFIPTTVADDGIQRTFLSNGHYQIYKSTGNSIRIRGGSGSVFIFISDTASLVANWKINQVNRLAWTCVTGANYVYLNGVLLTATYNTAWTGVSGTPQVVIGDTIGTSFLGTMCNVKLFVPATAAQTLTQKDCEVLSAGTTYTYWDSTTCIMDGLAANYDPTNYRHLDLSGLGNHVLLGNGAGTGTPTKLTAQGYSFNGTTQYMTVPLAAWPGANGTILIDVDYDSSANVSPYFWGTDHTSGTNYEHKTTLSASKFQSSMRVATAEKTVDICNPDVRFSKLVLGVTWMNASAIRGFCNGSLVATTTTTGAPTTPDAAWWLMRYNSDYTVGNVRSFLAFNRQLSSIQVADATMWMKNLRNKV